MLKATIDLALHRVDRVGPDLVSSPGAAGSREGRGLLADVALQAGRWDEARAAYEELISDDRAWQDLGRLADLERQLGDFELADRLYAEAEEELTAKQMRAYAWVELQRGQLDLARGRYDEARGHHALAERAYSGYWLTEQHTGEVLAAEDRVAEAIAVFERLVGLVPRPELLQALGDLYERKGLQDDALGCREQAQEAFLDSARRGQVHYYHHLAELHADGLDDPAEAVRWAAEDARLRPGPATDAALGWALYRNGDVAAALEAMRAAVASGLTDAALFRRAAAVHEAAGRLEDAQRLFARAAEIDPHHGHVHVHH